MPNQYVDWYSVSKPHPAALPNLQRIVDYMLEKRATHTLAPITIYRLTQHLDKQHKQVAMLLRGRPGFVNVIRDGKSQGFYWDVDNFGLTYPEDYSGLKGKHILSVEDLEEANIKAVKELNTGMAAIAKEASKEAVRNKSKPDIDLEAHKTGERATRLISFVPMPYSEIQQILGTVLGNPTDLEAQEIMTALLSTTLPSDMLPVERVIKPEPAKQTLEEIQAQLRADLAVNAPHLAQKTEQENENNV